MTTAIQFLDPVTGLAKPDVWGETQVLVSNRGAAPDGAVIECGRTATFAADDVIAGGHLLAFNLGTTHIDVEAKAGSHAFRRAPLLPGHVELLPAGQPFSQRNLNASEWGALELPPETVRRILGCDLELELAFSIRDPQLVHLVRALLDEVATGSASGALYTDALLVAAVARLSTHAVEVPVIPSGGLGRTRLRRVTDHIEDHLATRLTVADLAGVAGLSPAHFARAFKTESGQTPLAYVMGRRVERARELLAAGESIVSAAAAAGFSDQAHLSRLFKRRFGVTPGAFLRRMH